VNNVPVYVSIAVVPHTNIYEYRVEEQVPSGWRVQQVNASGTLNGSNSVTWGPFFDNRPRTLAYIAIPPVFETGAKSFSGTALFSTVSLPITGDSTVTNGLGKPNDKAKPIIAIVSPTPGVSVTNPSVRLRGTTIDDKGVAFVEFRIKQSDGSGPWQFASGSNNWASWSATVNDLIPGTNIVQVRCTDLFGNLSATNSRSIFYSVRAPLRIITNGIGTVTVSTNLNRLEIGRFYTLTAKSSSGYLFSNWVVSANMTESRNLSVKLSFQMQSNLTIAANFVPSPFAPYAGSFRGLFYETNQVHHARSGFFNLRLGELGGYTVTLLTAGQRYNTNGRFNLSGLATNRIVRPGTNALRVTWAVDLQSGNSVTGLVSGGMWQAPLLGYRAVFNGSNNPAPFAGSYTFILPGVFDSYEVPQGDGYGIININSNGLVTVHGALADNTKITLASSISTHGYWPFYSALYNGRGSVLGWVIMEGAHPEADLYGWMNWTRPRINTSSIYPRGFRMLTTNVLGSRYVAPANGTNRLLNMSGGRLIFSGGDLSADVTNFVGLDINNQVSNIGPHFLTMGFDTTVGLFNGRLRLNGAKKTNYFKGAVLQKANLGSGFFLGTNGQSGKVVLEPSFGGGRRDDGPGGR